MVDAAEACLILEHKAHFSTAPVEIFQFTDGGFEATPHNLTRRLSQDFCPNSKFGKWRNPSCIPIFQTEEVGKGTAEARRHNCAVLPLRGWIAEKRFLLAKSKCLCHNNKSLAAVPGIYGRWAAREAAVKSIGFIGISFIREEEGFS